MATPASDVRGQRGDLGEQLDQVDLDVPGVGPAAARGHVDAGLPAVAQLGPVGAERRRERLEHAEHLVDAVRVGVAHGEVADGPVQRGRQRAAQVGVRAGPRSCRRPHPARTAHRPQLAQQHGLADPAQAGEHEAAFRAPARDPSSTMSNASSSLSRPASSGGRWPRPARTGLRTGSTIGTLSAFSPIP
jgi:hypothetical protein